MRRPPADHQGALPAGCTLCFSGHCDITPEPWTILPVGSSDTSVPRCVRKAASHDSIPAKGWKKGRRWGTLQVMGAHLRHAGSDLEVWDEALAKLANAERMELDSCGTPFEQLRISYDALPGPEQRMFLDAATAFQGRRADTVVRAWRR